jgi:exopolysaccharide biosynthesis WecB/TagA/CpsF family protein
MAINNVVKILNIEMRNITQEDLLKSLDVGVLMTVNVDMLVKMQEDKLFYEIYQNTDWVICDSKILALGLWFLRTPIRTVIPGSSFFPIFYNYHKNNENIKFFLLGSAEGVANKAMLNINNRVGREIIVGAHSPSFGFEKNEQECNEIIQLINKSSATVLVVGVGAPKQEKWIYKYKNKLPQIKLFMPLGATIDFESGIVKRAPKIFQFLALEWFYRVCIEPKRLIRRGLNDLPFFKYLIRQKLGYYKNPFEN